MLEVSNVSLSFPSGGGVKDINLTVGEGELVVLVGPSGCGKTTLLRVIAGLERPDSGRIQIDGRDVSHLPAHERDIALAFQEPALLPHRSVRENIVHPLVCRDARWWRYILRRAFDSHQSTAEEWASTLAVSHLLARFPAHLSGGELQRVALARALAKEAAVLLLDEPLNSVDSALRDELRQRLLLASAKVRSGRTKAVIYVTHDREEALLVGDRLAVMRGGRIVQIGYTEDLCSRAVDAEVAKFINGPSFNVVPCTLTGSAESEELQLAAIGGTLSFRSSKTPKPQKELLLGFHGDEATIRDEGEFSGTLVRQRPFGARQLLEVETNGAHIRLSTSSTTLYAVGSPVSFDLDSRTCQLFDADTGKGIEVPP